MKGGWSGQVWPDGSAWTPAADPDRPRQARSEGGQERRERRQGCGGPRGARRAQIPFLLALLRLPGTVVLVREPGVLPGDRAREGAGRPRGLLVPLSRAGLRGLSRGRAEGARGVKTVLCPCSQRRHGAATRRRAGSPASARGLSTRERPGRARR